jgi:capsular polysaccharide biosynthesis protein
VIVGPTFAAAPRPGEPTIALARYAAVPGASFLHIVPGTAYPSVPPVLYDYAPATAELDSSFRARLARREVSCPEESVMEYRDAFLIGGKQVLASNTVAVDQSFVNVLVTDAVVTRHHALLDRIARGDIQTVDDGGPPFVAIFNEACMNYGHVLAEMLPRLVHLHAAGIRRMRLAMPETAGPVRAILAFALQALGLEAELIPCPPDSILRVARLHWVSAVARHEDRKSPTLLRLAERLRAASPATEQGTLLYLARPPPFRRPVANAAEIEAIAARIGYRVVEPSRLDFARQVSLFAGARAVAGPMGSALASCVLTPPGARVGMFEGGNCDAFFWDLACLAGHEFHWAFTAPVTDYDMAMLTRPITIAPAQAEEVLARVAG